MAEEEGEMVPKGRLDQEIDKRKKAAARVGELEQETRDLRGEVDRLKPLADNHETLVTEIGSLKEQITGLQSAREEDRAIFSRRFDDPDLVRFEHSRVTDAPPLGEWLEGLTAETAPSSLRGFFGEAETKTEEGAEAPQSKQTKRKGGGTANKGSGGSRAPSGTPAKMTPDRAQEIRAEAMRTGDWSAWRAYRGGSAG